MPHLKYANYGKDNVRLCKVDRPEGKDGVQHVTEMTVCTLLEGDIETSYTKADNSVVVPTDTQKQTTFILAKQNPISPPEQFASILASHFIERYSHIHVVHVYITQHKWTRLEVDGKSHPHSFVRDGDEKRTVEVTAKRNHGIEIKSGIKGLLVLKSTGSQFWGYDTQDAYTRLPETWDRILSTEVEAGWKWKLSKDLEEVKAGADKYDRAWQAAKAITLKTFAEDDSPSVQSTMYKMSELILEAAEDVEEVEYTLPNKHYFEIDLSWHKGLKNTGKDAEVYAPQTDPNGLIHSVVARDQVSNGA